MAEANEVSKQLEELAAKLEREKGKLAGKQSDLAEHEAQMSGLAARNRDGIDAEVRQLKEELKERLAKLEEERKLIDQAILRLGGSINSIRSELAIQASVVRSSQEELAKAQEEAEKLENTEELRVLFKKFGPAFMQMGLAEQRASLAKAREVLGKQAEAPAEPKPAKTAPEPTPAPAQEQEDASQLPMRQVIAAEAKVAAYTNADGQSSASVIPFPVPAGQADATEIDVPDTGNENAVGEANNADKPQVGKVDLTKLTAWMADVPRRDSAEVKKV